MCVLSHSPFHSHIQSFLLRLLTLLKLSQTRCLSLTGDGKSFPWRLYFWREQSQVSTKQDTILPHSHAQPGSSWATEYSFLAQQLCIVQMGWRREETICLIITTRWMLFLIPALRVASLCSTAPLPYFKQIGGLKALSLELLTSPRSCLLCPCSSKHCGSFLQVPQPHGSWTSLQLSHLWRVCTFTDLNHLSGCLMLQETRFHRSSEQPGTVHANPTQHRDPESWGCSAASTNTQKPGVKN